MSERNDPARPRGTRRPAAHSETDEKTGDNRKQMGTRGEQLIALHLERLGWQVLELNFRCRQGEIDVIAQEPTPGGNVLVFLEVKTRHGSAHGTPSEAVDTRKQRRIRGAAQAYLGARNAGGEEPACRFDVAEVFLDSRDLARIELRRASFMEE